MECGGGKPAKADVTGVHTGFSRFSVLASIVDLFSNGLSFAAYGNLMYG